MKIAILADPLDNQSAGVHTYTRLLIESLAKFDFDNEYVIIREKVDPDLRFKQIGVPNIRLLIGFGLLRLFVIIPLILRFLKVDAVFEPAHFGPFNLPKKIKRVTMIHDLTPIIFPEYHRFHSQLLQRIFLKRILRKTDLVLTNSENTSKDLVQYYPFTKSKHKTILLGRDTSFFPTETKNYHQKSKITAPYFICTGTIEPRKNLNILLEAYQLFREQTSSYTLLLIVGKDGWKTEKFYSDLEIHPFRKDIIMTGFIDKYELIELYSHALALIYPSIYEGFGLPILEAYSCGSQVICSNNSSLPEVGGDVALYFDTDNKVDLSRQMLKAFQNHNEGRVNKETFLKQAQNFSWEKYVSAFMQVMNEKTFYFKTLLIVFIT